MFSLAVDACGTRLHAHLDSTPIAVRCSLQNYGPIILFSLEFFTCYSRIILFATYYSQNYASIIHQGLEGKKEKAREMFCCCFFWGGGGGQEKNILRQVRNLNVWGAGKFSLKRCYIITHVVPLSAHNNIPLSQWRN